MPDSPAQLTVVLSKAEYGSTTERMATPEELLALQLLAEEEEAVIQAIESASSPAEPIAAHAAPPPAIAALEITEAKPDEGKPAESETEVVPVKAGDQQGEKKDDLQIDDLLSGFSELRSELATASQPTNHAEGVLDLAATLDQHRIWVESGGEAGAKADLCGANLENADLTGANLQ